VRSPLASSETRPGAIHVAPNPTTQPTVRSAPTAAAMTSSLSPFWRETTSLVSPR
jgi:hypothetical protein